MSLRVFDFVCPEAHTSEQFVSPETRTALCPICHRLAERLVAAPRAKLEGVTGAFPSASDKWVRNRESHMARERKNQANHNSYK